ncbi:MAG: cytidine deaminase [Crocinitomicaceae bacterium]|nr:cytidine deaminase [Crocinitomicaceae bacterium]
MRRTLSMEERKIHITYKSTNQKTDFSSAVQHLIDETISFSANAYAPYSDFKVSACLLLEDGKILKGTNVENASYPVCICAERTLVSHAVSNYPQTKIEVIAIYVDKDLATPVPPCGLCRQTLVEVENRQKKSIQILLIAKNGTIIQFDKCSDLLPLSFGSEFL